MKASAVISFSVQVKYKNGKKHLKPNDLVINGFDYSNPIRKTQHILNVTSDLEDYAVSAISMIMLLKIFIKVAEADLTLEKCPVLTVKLQKLDITNKVIIFNHNDVPWKDFLERNSRELQVPIKIKEFFDDYNLLPYNVNGYNIWMHKDGFYLIPPSPVCSTIDIAHNTYQLPNQNDTLLTLCKSIGYRSLLSDDELITNVCNSARSNPSIEESNVQLADENIVDILMKLFSIPLCRLSINGMHNITEIYIFFLDNYSVTNGSEKQFLGPDLWHLYFKITSYFINVYTVKACASITSLYFLMNSSIWPHEEFSELFVKVSYYYLLSLAYSNYAELRQLCTGGSNFIKNYHREMVSLINKESSKVEPRYLKHVQLAYFTSVVLGRFSDHDLIIKVQDYLEDVLGDLITCENSISSSLSSTTSLHQSASSPTSFALPLQSSLSSSFSSEFSELSLEMSLYRRFCLGLITYRRGNAIFEREVYNYAKKLPNKFSIEEARKKRSDSSFETASLIIQYNKLIRLRFPIKVFQRYEDYKNEEFGCYELGRLYYNHAASIAHCDTKVCIELLKRSYYLQMKLYNSPTYEDLLLPLVYLFIIACSSEDYRKEYLFSLQSFFSLLSQSEAACSKLVGISTYRNEETNIELTTKWIKIYYERYFRSSEVMGMILDPGTITCDDELEPRGAPTPMNLIKNIRDNKPTAASIGFVGCFEMIINSFKKLTVCPIERPLETIKKSRSTSLSESYDNDEISFESIFELIEENYIFISDNIPSITDAMTAPTANPHG